MKSSVIEADYPIAFRKDEAKELGENLKRGHSVSIVGMKRVGISNFLRFFIYHKDIPKTYIQDQKDHLFIPVDLNDLAEREMSPVWILTLKRVLDVVAKNSLPQKLQKEIETLFLNSIQLQDPLLTIDNVRKALELIVDEDILPTIFFLRFDRIKDVVTPQFFSNLESLRETTQHKLSFVFTSYRNLETLIPEAYSEASIPLLTQNIYLKPAKKKDSRIIFETYKTRYKMSLPTEIEEEIFANVDGYVQYIHFSLIIAQEKKSIIKQKEQIFEILVGDERINLQSEELWESLSKLEQEILLQRIRLQKISKEDQINGLYLWNTGLIQENGEIFSPLFTYYLKEKIKNSQENHNIEFTKKENLLFDLLKNKVNEVCERENIIESVWQEEESFGVSDWAIDRLVARVRAKLKEQNSPFEIETIKTRGYKLVNIK
jgi:DNA-binding winged helix-turn-helix (wHTH) protein